MRAAALCALAALGLLPAAALPQIPQDTGLEPEVLLLARLKVKMEQVLLRQPDYTCIQTVERSRRTAPARRFKLLDTLRLEVALVNGAEMFSWPGESEFRSSDIREIVTSGAIGSGSFASHARSVFLSNTARYEYVGQETLGMRTCERFDYRVPLNLSGYTLTMENVEAIVAYHGSFWVDSETLDLVKLLVHADVIPPELKLQAVETELWYERFQIGDSEFLLPELGVTTLTHLNGDQSRNEIRFSGCRQYTGESFLSFDAPPEPAEQKEPPRTLDLPEGLELHLALETPIEDGLTAGGDQVQARLVKDARLRRETIVPEGAIVSGRVLHLEKLGHRAPYFLVSLRFDELAFDNYRTPLTAELVRFVSYIGGGLPRLDPAELFPRGGVTITTRPGLENVPGAAHFYVKGGKLRIPPGSRMVWRVVQNRNGD